MDIQSKTCTTCDGDTFQLKCAVCEMEFISRDDGDEHGCAEGSVQAKCVECDTAESNCTCPA